MPRGTDAQELRRTQYSYTRFPFPFSQHGRSTTWAAYDKAEFSGSRFILHQTKLTSYGRVSAIFTLVKKVHGQHGASEAWVHHDPLDGTIGFCWQAWLWSTHVARVMHFHGEAYGVLGTRILDCVPRCTKRSTLGAGSVGPVQLCHPQHKPFLPHQDAATRVIKTKQDKGAGS